MASVVTAICVCVRAHARACLYHLSRAKLTETNAIPFVPGTLPITMLLSQPPSASGATVTSQPGNACRLILNSEWCSATCNVPCQLEEEVSDSVNVKEKQKQKQKEKEKEKEKETS